MKIEVFGPCNEDGSSSPTWEFEIENGCERVLVSMPGFYRDQVAPKAWGFKDGRQVDARQIDYDPQTVLVG